MCNMKSVKHYSKIYNQNYIIYNKYTSMLYNHEIKYVSKAEEIKVNQ